jgi:hypothetical protein
MGNYVTKYFGEIVIDETNDFEYIEINYNGQEKHISLSDCNVYGEKLKICLDILDKYVEINEIGKRVIYENFPENETVKYYFECHFDVLEEKQILEIFGIKTFDEFDIKKTVEKLEYPNLLFGIENGEINISVDYKVSKEYSNEILCVKMDEKLNVMGFSHES